MLFSIVGPLRRLQYQMQQLRFVREEKIIALARPRFPRPSVHTTALKSCASRCGYVRAFHATARALDRLQTGARQTHYMIQVVTIPKKSGSIKLDIM
jgi:hypothetical protein